MNTRYFATGLVLMLAMTIAAAETNFFTWIVVIGSLQLAMIIGAAIAFSRSFSDATETGNPTNRDATPIRA